MRPETRKLIKDTPFTEPPDYTEEDLQELCKRLRFKCPDPNAKRIATIIDSIHYMPTIFQTWCENAAEEIDYNGLFYGLDTDHIPIVLGSELDAIDEVIVRWRLDIAK